MRVKQFIGLVANAYRSLLIIDLIQQDTVIHFKLGIPFHDLGFQLELNDRNGFVHFFDQLVIRSLVFGLGLKQVTGVISILFHGEGSQGQKGDAVSVLPILMGVGMLFQSKIGGGIAGPSSSATQPKMMMYMMPILFTVLFYRMPSGLVIYWIINTVLSVAQQYYINKGADKADKEKAAIEEKNNKKPKTHRTKSKTKAKGR